MLPRVRLIPLKKLFSSVDVYGAAVLLPDMNDGELSHEPIHRLLLKSSPSPALTAKSPVIILFIKPLPSY